MDDDDAIMQMWSKSSWQVSRTHRWLVGRPRIKEGKKKKKRGRGTTATARVNGRDGWLGQGSRTSPLSCQIEKKDKHKHGGDGGGVFTLATGIARDNGRRWLLTAVVAGQQRKSRPFGGRTLPTAGVVRAFVVCMSPVRGCLQGISRAVMQLSPGVEGNWACRCWIW